MVTKEQSDRISDMLKVDFQSFGITCTYLTGPQATCGGCGKLSGLDDFVHNAMKLNVHDAAFMIGMFKNPVPNKTPPHKLECCVCGTTYLKCNLVSPRGFFRAPFLSLAHFFNNDTVAQA